MRRPPGLAQDVGAGAHRGGLAGPAGPIPASSSRGLPANAVTRRRWPASRRPVGRGPVAGERRVATAGPAGRAVGGRAGGEQPLLGVQHRLAGVAAGAVLGEHRLAVGAAQLGRLVEQGGALDRYGVRGGEPRPGDGVGELAVPRVAIRDVGAEEALGFGADVPGRPGGTAGC